MELNKDHRLKIEPFTCIQNLNNNITPAENSPFVTIQIEIVMDIP